jgi:predicted MFS family arabinose efflux permease
MRHSHRVYRMPGFIVKNKRAAEQWICKPLAIIFWRQSALLIERHKNSRKSNDGLFPSFIHMFYLYRSQTLRSLRHRNFRLLVIGALLSNAGDFMQNVAQAWLVWHLTGSAFLLGVVGFFDSVPRLFLGALGGALTDRLDRRRLLITTQALGMVQAFVYWLLVYFNFIEYWQVLILACFLGVVNTVNQTARQSLVNGLVPKEDLSNAIALHASVFNLSRILGPSIGGLVIALVGVAGCFFVNAVSFLALIATLLCMDLPPWSAAPTGLGIWMEVHQGFHYLKTNSRMFSIVLLSYVVAMIGAPYVTFVPVFATNILHVGASGFGLLMSAPGVGATVAGLWLASMGSASPNLFWVGACVLGYAIFLALFALSRFFTLSLFLLLAVGFCFIAFRASVNTALQAATPAHLLGRVLSFFFMDRGLWSIGGLILGASASAIGIRGTFELSAAICGIAAAVVLFIIRRAV